MSLRLALVGDGKMSRAIAALAASGGHRVVTVVTGGENPGGRALTVERLAGVDVALEFTRPECAADNLIRLAALGIPAVAGTTGWQARLEEVTQAVTAHGAALVHSANFSTGVQLFLRAATALAREFAGRPEFAAAVIETHHAAKRDAPSGTARALLAALRSGDAGRDAPVTSIRTGYVPGTHELRYDAPWETIQLVHTARGREAFAAGALRAAEWVVGRRGVFGFDEVLFGKAGEA